MLELKLEEADEIGRVLGPSESTSKKPQADARQPSTPGPSGPFQAKLQVLRNEDVVPGSPAVQTNSHKGLLAGIPASDIGALTGHKDIGSAALRSRLKNEPEEAGFQADGGPDVGSEAKEAAVDADAPPMPSVAPLEMSSRVGSGDFYAALYRDQKQPFGRFMEVKPSPSNTEESSAGGGRDRLPRSEDGVRDCLIRLEQKLDALLSACGPTGNSVQKDVRTSYLRLVKLEAQVGHLPTKGFVIAAAISVVALIAPMLVLQEAVPAMFVAMVQVLSSMVHGGGS